MKPPGEETKPRYTIMNLQTVRGKVDLKSMERKEKLIY